MGHKKKATDTTSAAKEKIDILDVKEKVKSKKNILKHVREFFTKEKEEFDGLTQVRQASFVVAGLLMLSLLSGIVGMLIILFLVIAFFLLGIQGKTFAKKVMPKLPMIFLGALVLVILFWIISFFMWMMN